MKIDNIIQEICKNLDEMDHIKADDIPNIDLYMDQVTTFMNESLASFKRYEDDKILTKTMINNYAKNDLLPSPNKKRYSKEHLLMLIFIYYFKGILSINDIQNLLNPITKKHFSSKDGLSLEDIYTEVFSLAGNEIQVLKKDLLEKHRISSTTFEGVEDNEFLQTFSFICMLSFDVYLKKQIIENIIDSVLSETTQTSSQESDSKKEVKKDIKKETKKEPKKEPQKQAPTE